MYFCHWKLLAGTIFRWQKERLAGELRGIIWRQALYPSLVLKVQGKKVIKRLTTAVKHVFYKICNEARGFGGWAVLPCSQPFTPVPNEGSFISSVEINGMFFLSFQKVNSNLKTKMNPNVMIYKSNQSTRIWCQKITRTKDEHEAKYLWTPLEWTKMVYCILCFWITDDLFWLWGPRDPVDIWVCQ